MQNNVEWMRAAYDRIVGDYDTRWSVHVAEPQRRLTRELALQPGERCADLGCGTGVDTVEMSKLARPGEVVGIDCSPNMLESARKRALAAGARLTTHCQGGDEFIADCEPASFDVISLRFCLGYLDWRNALPRVPRLLRAGGRVGILTILKSSAPQAYDTYRNMISDLGLPDVPLTALASIEHIEDELRSGGAAIQSAWTHDFRLEFDSGSQLASWLETSGIATSPSLPELPPDAVRALWQEFAQRVEAYREGAIVPLDFQLAGVVAHRSHA
ncbi:MAG TPA: class I SAM-dependent methyltransferase [Polyangiales bacterium]|nr:class I SAM-dependent methyltransferase [Polyangiales bacterium]